MKTPKKSRIGEMFSDGRKIDDAVRSAVREAILRHKRAGVPVAVWRDGKAVWVPADQVSARPRRPR